MANNRINYKVQKHWSKKLKIRHRLANLGLESFRPNEPNRDYYLFGDYQPPKTNGGSKAREMRLRRKAYEEAQAAYERDGYWKDEVTITQKQRLKYYLARVRYVREHPEDRHECASLYSDFILLGIFAVIAICFISYMVYLNITGWTEIYRTGQP